METLIQKSIVVIPTLTRTEFLALALERIARIPQAEHLDIRIFLDYTPDSQKIQDVEYVRDTYLPTADIFQANEHIRILSGTWNILNSLKSGFESGKEYIFFVEEDVAVAPNFFDWHWQTHQSDDYFVTCGRRLNRFPLDFYSNPGTCYRRAALAKVMPHICDAYFQNPEAYLNRHFSNMIGMDGFLDDGLIRKVQRTRGGKVLCAEPPVAAHQGFRYYNRLPEYINSGKTITEKISVLREMLPRISRTGRYTTDFESLPT